MKELNIPQNIHNEEFGITIKPFLTMGEIKAISNQVYRNKDYLAQKIAKEICLIDICTDIDVKKDDYDLYNLNGLIKTVKENVINYNDLEDFLKNNESLTSIIGVFLDKLNKTLESLQKKVPNAKVMAEFLKKDKK